MVNETLALSFYNSSDAYVQFDVYVYMCASQVFLVKQFGLMLHFQFIMLTYNVTRTLELFVWKFIHRLLIIWILTYFVQVQRTLPG